MLMATIKLLFSLVSYGGTKRLNELLIISRKELIHLRYKMRRKYGWSHYAFCLPKMWVGRWGWTNSSVTHQDVILLYGLYSTPDSSSIILLVSCTLDSYFLVYFLICPFWFFFWLLCFRLCFIWTKSIFLE